MENCDKEVLSDLFTAHVKLLKLINQIIDLNVVFIILILILILVLILIFEVFAVCFKDFWEGLKDELKSVSVTTLHSLFNLIVLGHLNEDPP